MDASVPEEKEQASDELPVAIWAKAAGGVREHCRRFYRCHELLKLLAKHEKLVIIGSHHAIW
jgi:hypothetical protein